MATLPTDYQDPRTPTGALTELPATTSRGINAINAQINANTTAIAGLGGGSGDMVLASAQTVTGAKTFNAGTLLDKGSTVVNVKAYGVTGNGSTDDTTNIQAAINGSAVGSTVFFPGGTYLISAPIVLKAGRRYLGAGEALGRNGAVIKQKNTTNMTNAASLTGLLVAEAWSTNATTCDSPISIENLCVDGNFANNATSTACGIVLTNFNSKIHGCYITGTPKHGVLLTDTTANGTNVVTNSCSENRVTESKIDTTGGDGIKQISGNGNSNQDGYCFDNWISATTGSGIVFARAAGWSFRRNHLYDINVHGISLDVCYATSVTDNYVEDFGSAATASADYDGIFMRQIDEWGSVCSGNLVSCRETSSSVSSYEYLRIRAGGSQTDAKVICVNNIIRGPASPTNKGEGLALSVDSGGVLTAYIGNNHVQNVNTPRFYNSAAVVIDRNRPRALQVSNTTSWTIDSNTYEYAENTGLTGAVTLNNPSGTPGPGQRLQVALTGTASRAISYGTAFESSTVTLPTTTSGTARLDIWFVWNSATSKWRCVRTA